MEKYNLFSLQTILQDKNINLNNIKVKVVLSIII